MEPCTPQIICETNGPCTIVRCGTKRYPLGCKLSPTTSLLSCGVYEASPLRLRGRADTVDLSSKLPPVWNQGEIGSCTAQSLAAVLAGRYRTQPSRLFLYYCGRAVGDLPTEEDTGCTMGDAIKGAQLYGFCDEALWPYREDRHALCPAWPAFLGTQHRDNLPFESVRLRVEDLVACLSEGHPLVLGIAVYPTMFDKTTLATGIIPTPNPRQDQLMGGHAITIAGYDLPQRQFIVRNSWGPEWGRNGYGRISFDYLTHPQLAMDAFTLRG